MPPATSAELRFRAYVAPHRRALAALAGGLGLATALPLLGPQLLRRFVDTATAGAETSTLLAIAVTYLVVALSAQAVTVAVTYWTGQLAWRASNVLREDLAAHVLGLDLSFHMHRTAGELIERIDGDVTALAEFVSRFLLHVVGSVLLLTGAVVLVSREDARIGLVLIAFLAVAGLALPRLQRRTVPAATAEREAQALLLGTMEERLAGLDDLRALGAGPHAMVRFHERSGDLYAAHLRWQRVSGGVFAATNLVFALGVALLVGMGIVLVRQGAITTGTVLLLFQYASLVRRPLEQIIGQFKEFQEAAAGAARVRELMTLTPSITEPADGGRPLAAGPLAVSFDHVTFAYPGDPPVLHDPSLTVAAGRSLGLVGRTGSGKTTIARLLLRLYDTTEGSVELGGVDLRATSLDSLRSRVRIVTQDVQLFAASVRRHRGRRPPRRHRRPRAGPVVRVAP
jgi:ABC-type multidrug transport system fused ATPase/permease subunit